MPRIDGHFATICEEMGRRHNVAVSSSIVVSKVVRGVVVEGVETMGGTIAPIERRFGTLEAFLDDSVGIVA